MLELVVTRGADDLVVLPLDRKTFRIGQSSTNDLAIPDPSVAAQQCELLLSGDEVHLIDHSGQGTVVDGQAQHKTVVRPGCQIVFGNLNIFLNQRQDERPQSAPENLDSTDILPSSGSDGDNGPLRLRGSQVDISLQGSLLTIGSDPGNDLVLKDSFVSSFHCRLYKKDGAWFVSDLDSTNGTRVNEVQVSEARLEPGSELKIGELSLHLEQAKQTSQPHPGFQGIISEDPAFSQVFELISRAAPSDETVLITGESGSGKELVAQALHDLSRRAKNKLVPLNCSAISKDLMESELFGHEKGAFTGAQSKRKGLFEEAQRGTLFLDEIGELPLDLQAKLLRVLESGEIRPVGSNQARRVDTRVVAATHRSLPQRVSEGAFREDLYYRLNVIEISLPPLRHRPADIPLLAQHFLERYTSSTLKRSLSPKSMEHLCAYGFPGNVRELKNTITRAAILCPQELIEPEHLTFTPATLAERVSEGQTYRKGKTLREIEMEAVRQVLEANDFNQKAAARTLGIARSTLITKMEKYNIQPG